MNKFIFESYKLEGSTAIFDYGFEDGLKFQEKVVFETASNYSAELLDKALFLSFILIGTSYYKTFPSREVEIKTGGFDTWQVDFFNHVYQEGLSQFAFENNLTRDDLAQFTATDSDSVHPVRYDGHGILALQSGGKDSLLTASLLIDKGEQFVPWYISSSSVHPAILDNLGYKLQTAKRQIDHVALKLAAEQGGKNGHVPVTYIVQSLALIQAILLGKNKVLVSIGHEGEEPHDWIGDLPVNHQWSKTWPAEQAFSQYVNRYISADITIGSPLRQYSELRIAELFVQNAWQKFGHRFSSCNVANYQQGVDNSDLKWCGDCPKCANSYLLFAPFLSASELKKIFHGQDLLEKASLQDTFKGLLGVDGVMKPFECVGEVDELRLAYHMAQQKDGYGRLSFDVPESSFDYRAEYPSHDISIH